jgi:hypothetical protein
MRKTFTLKSFIAGTALFLTGAMHAQTTTPDPAGSEEFKPSGNVWGYVFGDYAFKSQNDSLGRGAGNVQYRGTGALNSNNVTSAAAPNLSNPVPANVQSNAFQIRRAYLGYDYQFAKNFSVSTVLANEQTLLPNNQNTVYLKYAFVKWSNIWKNSDLIIGQFQTASFATSGATEPLWGYRSIERTLLDLHNIDGSTDLGFSLQGKLWEQKNITEEGKKPMFFGYAFQLGNGSSAVPESDPYKKVRVNLYASLCNQKLVIGLYGDYTTQQYSPYHTSNTTYKAYISYRNEAFHVGAEVFQQTNQNSDIYKVYDKVANKLSAGDTSSGVQMGVSVFGSAKIIKNKLSVFARYDMYNPDTKWNTKNVYSSAYSGIKGSNLTSATFYTQTFLTAGLDWTPDKRFHIMPNVWYNAYNSMMSSAYADGTGKPLSSRMVKDEDIVYRVTFYYIFNPSKKVNNNGFY